VASSGTPDGNDRDDGAFQASGIIGSVVGAILCLLIYRAVTNRSGNRALH
jgi:uncharacterized membrane protein YeaQ/YmgE (transglycosylase-associated protein family)